MRLVNISVLTGKDGRTAEFWINPEQIVSITTVNIPGKLTRPDGTAIMEEKTAIDFGVKALLTNLTVAELIDLLALDKGLSKKDFFDLINRDTKI